MSDPGDSKLEALLRERARPVASADLAARIVRAARELPQRRALSWREELSRLLAELPVPRPAFALAATLIIGLVAGWTAPFDPVEVEPDADAVYVASFLYPDDEDAS
jgi:hypothetical protein